MTSQADISPKKYKRPIRPIGRRVWILYAFCMFLLFVGTAAVYWYTSLQTYHLAPVQIGVLYRDGNRDLRELKHALTFTGAKTVVSLIDDRELNDPNKPQFLQETNYCTLSGIQYIRIPVQLGGWPSSDDVKTFLSVVTNPANQPVLVHCAQGVRRTGMFVAAYQESVLHQSPDQTKAGILNFGHKPRDTDDVREFIDDYDPVNQKLADKPHGLASE
jgi:protein tyrosine phosphatase (PTP) superfamily phosphohydrolase (DUF442 family)